MEAAPRSVLKIYGFTTVIRGNNSISIGGMDYIAQRTVPLRIKK
jgi:hypothetical protein